MPWTILVVFAYAAVTIILGIVGMVHKGSVASLIAAGISGAIVIAGGILAKHHPKVGYGLVIFVAVATLGRFGMSFAKNKDLYPSGLIILTALIGLLVAIAGLAGLGSSK